MTEEGWIKLFDGRDLSGWRMRFTDREHHWVVRDDILENTARGVDIISEQEFGDFELHLEFLVPKDSNSGIGLRGRYEIQILDSLGQEYDYPCENGSLYDLKSPDVEASKPAGEWQTIDIELRGMILSAVLNGQKIHDKVTIERPTGIHPSGGDEHSGPLILQGDHGPILFRDIRLREL